jgi:tRNA(Ile)-lysidine synthase
MLRGGETVLAAVSGGADSVALLSVLRELAPALGLTLHAAHVHHGLRAEADRDARSVEALCARLGVPFHEERIEVRRAPPWEGLEAEARHARYAALGRLARLLGAARIATGHTADDQAETVLMRLLQGAGPRGLRGIAPERGLLIRPLIEVRRAEIEAYLRSGGIGWVEDASNRDSRFLRNRIRHEVLPFLAERWSGIVPSLCRSAALARELVGELERRAEAKLGRLGRRGPAGIVLPVPALAALPEELALEIVRRALATLGVEQPLRAAAHRALRRLLALEAARRPVRIGPLAVERSGRWLRVGPASLLPLRSREWRAPGCLDLPEVGLALEARGFDRPPGYVPPRDPRMAAFDADRLPPVLTVRARRRGDRFTPFGADSERRLKAFLIDAGVPRWERSRVPLLEARGEIVWVAGVRRGRAAPVRPATRRILEVTLRSL